MGVTNGITWYDGGADKAANEIVINAATNTHAEWNANLTSDHTSNGNAATAYNPDSSNLVFDARL